MRRARNLELLPVDLEPERTFRFLRGIQRDEHEVMAEHEDGASNENNQQWAIQDYVRPVVNDNYSGIARLAIAANNFE